MKNLIIAIVIVTIIFLSGCETITEPVYQVQAVVINVSGTGICAVTVLDLSGSEAEEVTDATVTINSITVPYVQGQGYADTNGSLGLTLSTGANVHLTVDKDELSVDENMSVPDTPVVTSPTFGSSHDASAPITVNWNAFTNEPDELSVKIIGNYTVSGTDFIAEVATDATSYNIPANTLNSGQSNVFAVVDSLNTMGLNGDNLTSSSAFVTGNEGYSPFFNTN